LNELALFAGAGGGILGGKLLGWKTVCAVEWEAYPASVLCARQNDGLLPTFPIWDDVQTFDGKPWRGIVDVISGGFPCQDISAAGKGAGIDGERSGMWGEMARIICEVRPRYVFVENSPMLTSRGLGRVLGDLASMGFNARWGVLGAANVGAKHQRDRIWIVGKVGNPNNHGQIATKVGAISAEGSNSDKTWQEQASKSQGSSKQYAELAYTKLKGLEGQSDIRQQKVSWAGSGSALAYTEDKGDVWRDWQLGFTQQEHDSGRSSTDGSRQWWSVEPSVGRVAHGVACRVDRLKAIGNGQVPLCAATAWRILSE
jgi:DNA (cytosine-5)-methyltransferase 1